MFALIIIVNLIPEWLLFLTQSSGIDAAKHISEIATKPKFRTLLHKFKTKDC